MRCIICDRCKKIVEDEKKIRVVTCSRPIRFRPGERSITTYIGNDPKMNDILWQAEICGDCVDELEAFFSGEPVEPEVPVEPLPEEPEEGDKESPDTDGTDNPKDPEQETDDGQ